MALRDQPYIPLYIQDIMTDEKLNECCAATHGIYIKGILCLMHKSEQYGKILLKQKYKQTESISRNFALMLVKHLPYSEAEIEKAIDELIREKVCYFEDDYICQKRMIKDNAISEARSDAGKKGGGNPNFVSKLVKTKIQTKHEYENENVNENKDAIELNIWCIDFFDKKFLNKKSIETFDKLLRIDNYSVEQIKNVIKFARNDMFWSNNFLTPNKLRNKNKEGVKYMDVFLAKIKPVRFSNVPKMPM
jgi:hypothetical protein